MIPRLFYGWWIVAAAVLFQFTFLSVSQSTVSVFLRPVVQELGWQVWQFTLGSSLGVLAGALSGVLVGRLVDQRGPSRLALVGAVVSALCLYALGRQSHLYLFWALHLCAGFVGWTLFGPLVVNTTINKWFLRRRGWALAIGSTGISFGGLISPYVMTQIVDSVGWRNGYTLQALFVLAVVGPVALLMRRAPEDVGLLPDGEAPQPESEKSPAAEDSRFHTARQALRTSGFWLLLLGYSMNQAALSSVLAHAVPFATDASFSRRTAALALAVNGFGNLISKAFWGYCLQRFPPRRLAVLAFAAGGTGVGMMLLAAVTANLSLLFGGFLLYGFGFGGTIPVSEYLWVSYFGRAHIGAIRGVAQPLTVIGPTIAPVLVGLVYDFQGNYRLAFLGIIAIYFLAGILVAVSRAPSHQSGG